MSARMNLPVVRNAFVFITLCFLGLPAWAKYGGGSGMAANPYRVATKKDLLALAADPGDYGAHFILTADINLSGETFQTALIAAPTDIGPEWQFIGTPFTGMLDGDGHTIRDLTIDDRKGRPGYLGLFGCIGRGGRVRDLNLDRVSVMSGGVAQYISGLVALNDGGTITRCSVAGTVTGDSGSSVVGSLAGMNGTGGTIFGCHAAGGTTSGGLHVGGLIGFNAFGASIIGSYAMGDIAHDRDGSHLGGLVGSNEGAISHCYATGGLTGCSSVGGLAGWNSGTITDCCASGNVNGDNGFHLIGGLVGWNEQRGIIANCHATGNVAADDPAPGAGGLVGSNEGIIAHSYATGSATGEMLETGGLAGSNSGTIHNCYATGTVSGEIWAGGLVALNGKGGIINCYSVGEVSGDGLRIGGLAGSSSWPDETMNSFWDTQTSGQTRSACGTGKTTAQMQTAQTFLDASWDFDCIWDIVEGQTYPFLRPAPAADLTCDVKVDLRDFAILAANWRASYDMLATLPAVCRRAGDLTYDGRTDARDLRLMAAQWLDGPARTGTP